MSSLVGRVGWRLAVEKRREVVESGWTWSEGGSLDLIRVGGLGIVVKIVRGFEWWKLGFLIWRRRERNLEVNRDAID